LFPLCWLIVKSRKEEMSENPLSAYSRDYINSLETAIASFNKNKDSDYYRYPLAVQLYCETTLNLSEIATMLQLEERVINSWWKENEWEEMRKELFPVLDAKTIKYIEKKTVEAKLKHSRSIEEQLSIIGNTAAQEVYRRLADPNSIQSMDDKDVLGFFTKVKDLEAKVSGQIKQQSTQITINNNAVYRKLVEKGFDQMYEDAIDVDAEVLEAPPIRALPDHVSRDIPAYREKYTKLSDDEAEELLNRPLN